MDGISANIVTSSDRLATSAPSTQFPWKDDFPNLINGIFKLEAPSASSAGERWIIWSKLKNKILTNFLNLYYIKRKI